MNDAMATLGGFPFGNIWKWYSGSNNDILLNQLVPRRKADTEALDEMKSNYNTQGVLNKSPPGDDACLARSASAVYS